MAVRFSEIWLLIGVVFVTQLPVTRCQLCPRDSTFHRLTGSCIGLIKEQETYLQAQYYCSDYFGGGTTKIDGHLVFIFDQATDEFVKGLLDEHDVDSALIGLNDRAANGNYAWGTHNLIKATYTAWADNPHKPDVYKNVVVTTKDGWLEYYGSSQAYFVCQVSVDFPTPRIVCPLAEVGKQSPSIICTTDTHTSLSVTGVRFMKTTHVVASCNTSRCLPSQEYGPAVDVSKTSETRNSASWTLGLRDVSVSDVTDWTCSVEFNNTGYWVASRPCSLGVYKKPTDIQCIHQFIQEKVRTTCTAAQVYPQVGCQWTVNHGTQSINVDDPTVSNDVTTTDGYYRATCSASFYVTNAGTYDATVAMVPKVPNFQIEAVTKTITLSVVLPQGPPHFYAYHAGQTAQFKSVEVVENQTLTVTCQVPGGYPSVYRIIIKCYDGEKQFNSSSATIHVDVTRDFNGQSCTCSALHAARYTQTSSIVTWVTYQASITEFRITAEYTSTDIESGEEITFSCRASGYPAAQLTIQRQDGHTVTNSSTGDVAYQKKATCSDTGTYVCLASNMVQGQPHHDSRVVHLKVRCAPEHCRGEPSVSLPVAVGDQPAIIKMCVRAFPAPTSFSLYKGNTTSNMLKADKFQAYFNFTNEEEGLGEITVKISPFTQEDLGDHTMSPGYRTWGDVKLHSFLMFSLFPQGLPRIDMIPTISPNNAKVGDPEVKITCYATGYPQSTFEFRKNGNIIPEAMVDEVSGVLTINDIKREDEGNYTCLAKNRGGSDEKSIYLDVKIVPVISEIPDVKDAVEGGQKTVTCMAEGDPAPTVIWRKEGQPAYTNGGIEGSGPTLIDEGGTDREDAEIKRVGKTMVFSSIKAQDAGTYVCTAINVVGNATKTIKFEVKYKPNFDTDYNVTTFYSWRGHTANLTCQASANEVATIKWYEIRDNRTVQIENESPYTITGPQVWPDYYLTSSSLLVYATDDTSPVFKDYICEATNSLGSARQTVTLRRALITTSATTTADTTNTTEASKTVRQDFECHLNYMHVFIPVELVPNSQLTLRELNCRLLNNGTHHKISFDYDECGTSQSFFEDYISIDNEVNVHNILNNTAEITFVEDYTIPLKCLVDRSKHVNGAIQVISRESIHENAVQSTDFHMKEFTTKDYDQEITEYPIQLPINREIFFEVALTNSSSNSTGIFVEKCEATPSIHRNGTVRVSLINFGCSVNPAVKVLPVPEIDRFRFSIQAFHFSGPENVDNMVYVHCSASTCGGVMCDNTCPKSSRRRRRSTRGQASATLTSGSHVVG